GRSRAQRRARNETSCSGTGPAGWSAPARSRRGDRTAAARPRWLPAKRARSSRRRGTSRCPAGAQILAQYRTGSPDACLVMTHAAEGAAASAEIGDLARGAAQLEDVQACVRAVDDVDVAAVVHLDVVGLDRHLAALVGP